MNKHLKRLTASLSALCLAATFCSAISASAVTLYPKTVMTKSSTMWNSYRNQNIKLDYCTSKSDGKDYLFEPGRGIKVVSTYQMYRDIYVDQNDISLLYANKSYDYQQAAQCALYNTEKAYDFLKNAGYKPNGGDIFVAINDISTYSPNGNGGERENAWGKDNTIFLGMGSSNQNTESSVKFLGAATDTVTHEYMHLITGEKLGWDSYGTGSKYRERNALMEAYSDIMAELADERGDWKVGTTVFTKNSSRSENNKYSFRNLAVPGDTINPKTSGLKYYGDYYAWLRVCNIEPDSTLNAVCGSTVISHAAYLMHQKGYSNDVLAKIWMKSVDKFNKSKASTATFSDCRKAFNEAAIEVLSQTAGRYYNAQVLDLMSCFDEVGVK